MNFQSHGYTYLKDEFGVHQLNPDPYTYDETYCATYDTEDYKRGNDKLQALRLGFAACANQSPIKSILDFGCGNYAFLKAAKKVIPYCYGFDISGITPPHDIVRVKDVSTISTDVVCFFDSLEHTEKPERIIQSLNCSTIVISLPYCHFERGIEWFDKDYFHLKPNEHLHHYDQHTLSHFMRSLGWKTVSISNIEDAIRKRDAEWNILTCAFKKM